MVTSAPGRRAATTVAAVALLCSVGGLGGTAWADQPSPTPSAVDTLPATDTSTPEAPAVQPTVGTWIVGGTLLEGTQSKPVAQPVAKPVAKPATRHRTSSVVRPATTVGDATVLPFTGPGHVDLLLPIGLLLLATGLGMTVAGRPRPIRA